jgi:O-antigen ligase
MWLLWVKLKLPFLLFPIAFFLAWQSIASIVQDALKCLWVVMLSSSLIVLTKYALDFQMLNESFFSGGAMPTPFSHIRYSLLLVISFFVILFHQTKFNYLLLFFFFVFIHLLSVRSGILALYVGLVVYAIYTVFLFQNWKKSALVLGSAILLAVCSYSFLPSIKNKLSYMRYDLSQWQERKIDGNSDAMRISSLITGVEIAKENPWLGVGAGDILKDAKEKHKQLFPNVLEEQSRKMPHNELLWTLCVSGIAGLSLFLFAWLYPVFYFRKQVSISFIIIQLVFAVSFMVEYTLEEQIGGSLFILLFLLFLAQFNLQKCQPFRS